MRTLMTLSIVLVAFIHNMEAQEYRWISVGSLHNWYRADGCEPEVGRYSSAPQQDGLRWPAQYPNQDCQAAKGLWIGTTNYTDAEQYGGTTFPYKVVHCGPRVSDPNNVFMPVEFKLVGRFAPPRVSVDGQSSSGLRYDDRVNEYDESLHCDRMIYNVVNTSIGITMTRKVMAWTHPGHDNYFIYHYTFTNTGNVDTDADIEQFVTLSDVYFFFQYRYAISREPFSVFSYWVPHSCMWGHNTMLDARGENPASGDPFRALFAWHGRHSQWAGPGDNIGGPQYNGDGHLGSAQYVGTVVLHADQSSGNPSNDPFQPRTTQYLGSDVSINYSNSPFDSLQMEDEYAAMTAGHPDIRHADAVGDGYADIYGGTPGGYSHGQGFGPYTLAPGDEITIVIAEGASGLSREKCYEIGDTWLNGSAPFPLPDGSTTSDRNTYKNEWVFTGKDSLFQTFNQAIANYDDGLDLPQPPPPPSIFNVISDSAKIILEWDDAAETDPTFAGYRIFRSAEYYNSMYDQIFACGQGTDHPQIVNEFHDEDIVRGYGYFYYIISFSDGSTSNGKSLSSSLFWTRTTNPVFLTIYPWILEDLYVSPEGNDTNSGLTAEEPFQTISKALGKVLGTYSNPRTIHLAPGIYSPSVTAEPFPLRGRHNVTLSGSGRDKTILSCEDSLGTLYMENIEHFGMENLTIQDGLSHYVGQIETQYSDLSMRNITVKNNASGAIYARDCRLSLTDVNINNNGYGISYYPYEEDTYMTLKNVTVKNNTGTGIYIGNGANVTFDPDDRCTIYHNGRDLSISTNYETVWPINVFVDTFSVYHPSNYHTYPVVGFNMDMQYAIDGQVTADLYVNPEGSDENSGLSAGAPLKTIEKAIRKIISDRLNPRSIFLSPGVYGPHSNGESIPVLCNSYTSIKGEDPETTILDASQSGSVLKAFRNKDVLIENIWMREGAYNISISACENFTFHRVAITDHIRNHVTWGPALIIDGSQNVNLINVTIAGNKAFNYYGDPTTATALRINASRVNLINSLLWYNGNEPIHLLSLVYPYGGYPTNLAISYSNNQFGDSCFTPPFMGYFHWLEGNLDIPPMFRDTTHNDYRLSSNSPCIDAGIQDTMIVYNDGLDTIFIPAMTYLGSAPDMGAFEFDPADPIEEDMALPREYALYQNYPNPFNPVTTIVFELPKACRVELQIYNSIGQRVRKLVNDNLPTGRHVVRFDGSGLASGVYFYRIQADQFNAVKKMLLIR